MKWVEICADSGSEAPPIVAEWLTAASEEYGRKLKSKTAENTFSKAQFYPLQPKHNGCKSCDYKRLSQGRTNIWIEIICLILLSLKFHHKSLMKIERIHSCWRKKL